MIPLLLTAAFAHAGDGDHAHVYPSRVDTASAMAAWSVTADARVSPVQWGRGSRVAIVREGAPDDAHNAGGLTVEARGASRSGARGPWIPAEITFEESGTAILIAELGQVWDGAEVRVPRTMTSAVRSLAWEPLVPTYPRAGAEARAAMRDGPTRVPVLRSELAAIGVVSRETWGARPTTCTSREDDWYRIAVHHTAGNPTSGGTIEGSVRFVQAYAQDSGTYCDTPYQYLVGVDGSLWEGRAEGYTSGATYNANDGNIAVSFMGCFTPTGCPGDTTDVTEEMIAGGHRLVQELRRIEGVDTDSVKGHKDWSGWDHTQCPGDWLYARLDDLREPLETWGGRVLRSEWPSDGVLRMAVGSTVSGAWELQNTGDTTWSPELTKLAPLPRDVASPFAGEDWLSPTRVVGVDARVGPGATGRFPVTLRASEVGTYDLAFGLVQEGVRWFADDAGPADDAMTLRVVVTAGDTGEAPARVDTGTGTEGVTDTSGLLPGQAVRFDDGCGCAAASDTPVMGALVGLAAAWSARRRRRG